MADWPGIIAGGNRTDRITAVSAATSVSSGTATGSPTQNTKGAWVELVTATDKSCNLLSILMNAASVYDHLVDIGVGPAGSEVVLIANLLFSRAQSTSTGHFCYTFPVNIPAGTRIAVRSQCKGTNNPSVRIQLLASAGSFQPHLAGAVATFGANTADSGGTAIDPGAVLNTKGAWTQIAAATDSAIKAIVMAIGQQAILNRASANNWLLDIGIGAAGAETVIIADYALVAFNDSYTTPQPSVSPLIPVDIPAGARIAARIQASNVTSATERSPDLILYGVS